MTTMRRPLARQDRSAPTTAAPAGERATRSAAGRPLPGAVRARMETAFGADFSDVTVREDGATAALDAVAVTRGNQISFSPGMYDVHSPEGLEVIGHELAHVLQQRSGRVHGSGVTEVPALESEAHEAGRQAAHGASVMTREGEGPSGEQGGVPSTTAPQGSAPAGAVAQPSRVGDFFRRLFRRGNGAPAAAPGPVGPAPAPSPGRGPGPGPGPAVGAAPRARQRSFYANQEDVIYGNLDEVQHMLRQQAQQAQQAPPQAPRPALPQTGVQPGQVIDRNELQRAFEQRARKRNQ